MDRVVLLNERSFKGTVHDGTAADRCRGGEVANVGGWACSHQSILFTAENGHTLTIPWSAIAWIDYGEDEPQQQSSFTFDHVGAIAPVRMDEVWPDA